VTPLDTGDNDEVIDYQSTQSMEEKFSACYSCFSSRTRHTQAGPVVALTGTAHTGRACGGTKSSVAEARALNASWTRVFHQIINQMEPYTTFHHRLLLLLARSVNDTDKTTARQNQLTCSIHDLCDLWTGCPQRFTAHASVPRANA
jgi:hypothetical protein